jgi:hypothetical protein
LENLDAEVDINEAWDDFSQNSQGYYELKNLKPWFDE